MTLDSASYNDSTVEAGFLRASFRVEPHPDAGCVLLTAGSRGTDVRQAIVTEPSGERACRVETALEGEEEPSFHGGSIDERCVCPVFDDHDCIASVDAFSDGALLVSVSTRDRTELSRLVASLRAIGATVRLERITRSTDAGDDKVIELDAGEITEKQREAVRIAMERGYYESPRRIDLGGLADELGVSRSAVSQRLGTVEAKLVAELFEVDERSASSPSSESTGS